MRSAAGIMAGAGSPVWITAAVLFIASLSFFWFPGHTFLQSDTQIYIPILEHIESPSLLAKDPMAIRPHVSFTIYDEVVLAIRRITGASYAGILQSEQFLFRVCGIAGLFLLASSAGLSTSLSLAVAAIVSLGATVAGPTVLTVEYEPVPRAFALPLAVLAIGLLAKNRTSLSAVAGSVAWALHPPTAMPVWLLLSWIGAREGRWRDVLILLAAIPAIGAGILLQPQSAEHASMLSRIDPALEAILRMRSSYNWVDMWIAQYWSHFTLLFVAESLALWRIRSHISGNVRLFLFALPVLGIISVPFSWLLLEKLGLAFAPQYQFGRYLVYVTLFASLSCTVAGILAAGRRSWFESLGFLVIPFVVPLAPGLFELTLPKLGLALALGAVCVIAVRREVFVLAAATLAFILIPIVGRVVNFSVTGSPELQELISWVREATPADSVFQFADVRRGLEPGILRAEAPRAIYADWKAGGQVNFLPSFARLWAQRWKDTERPQSLSRYRELGVDYVVFRRERAPKTARPVYSNRRWSVFQLRQ